MSFSETLYVKTDALFSESILKNTPLFTELTNYLSSVTEEEQLLLKLLYGTLPISDVASVPFETLMDYVRHALFLRNEIAWCRSLPEDLFLHFVFYPRINDENLVPCRSFFCKELISRIETLSAKEQALEINRWCCENMTYHSADDRTESPMAAYLSGLGRCGEESTFAVSAFRSVGIPARQVYARFWAHCDDNHAWVEVYLDGEWYFLGACEPEPILNRGWFTDASSRAPIECYRTFFETTEDTAFECDGPSLLYNVTDRYAETSRLTLLVKDEDGKPVENASVRLSVVNMASFCTIANLKTDKNGEALLRAGRCTIYVEAAFGGTYAASCFDLTGESEVKELVLGDRPENCSLSFTSTPPEVTPKNKTVLTDREAAGKDATLLSCAKVRNDRIRSYFLPEYTSLSEDWQMILRLAGGNAPELYAFYQKTLKTNADLALSLLKTLREKDYKDITCEILESHLRFALPFQDQEHFEEAILCPRIGNELISSWRPVITASFTEEEKNTWKADPKLLMAELEQRFPEKNSRFYSVLSMQPDAVLKAGCSDRTGRRLFFVAVMRTLGIPSRLNPDDGTAEYFRNGSYHCAELTQNACAALTLLPTDDTRLTYRGNYSLARWDEKEHRYQTLSALYGTEFLPGDYSLLTSVRLPNGKQLCTLTRFPLSDQETKEVPLTFLKASPDEMLSNSALERFTLKDREDRPVSSDDLLEGRTVLLYLDCSKEPTEHILNEISEAAEGMKEAIASGLKLVYILKNKDERKDPTLNRALSFVPEAVILYDDTISNPDMLARKLFLESGVWPLLILTDETRRGYYGTCGYQVGTLELTLSLNKCITELL